ncbi:hypothetical protein SPHINGO8BC_50558 [Sphingobacterium multivorum]|uniref:Uncharacterized protein n=1 Tax=Sphingobacterium multivorum TaxID=28454 RepID=A0A654C4G2_SPHMU|nr:hypothetical protein SPHINGO8BC_50558 [Sphingobacterium multivorum]
MKKVILLPTEGIALPMRIWVLRRQVERIKHLSPVLLIDISRKGEGHTYSSIEYRRFLWSIRNPIPSLTSS